jgi:hypothetical protein
MKKEFLLLKDKKFHLMLLFNQGSRRELGTAWTREECTYQTVECFDTFTEEWKR